MSTAERIQLLVMDVDGTLTDGKIYINEDGGEIKSFCVQDGAALKMLMEAGVRVAVVSGRASPAVEKRAQELGIEDLYQGVQDKFKVLSDLLKKFSLSPSEVAYMGDDLNDLPVMRQVGYSFAPANARQIVKEFAHTVTEASGGEGAVSEACEKILRLQGKWDELIAKHL